MIDIEFRRFHEEKYKELSDDVKQRAIAVIQSEIPLRDKELIKQSISDNPNTWATPYHFGWGMGIRNLLRTKGILDNELPSGNWDDYYVMVVEEALKRS